MKNKCIMKNVEIFRCTCALVGLACTSAFAQVKHASFSEIINPVVVDGGTESIPMAYEAAAAWGDYNNDGFSGSDYSRCNFTRRANITL